jgi:hypothetical protein
MGYSNWTISGLTLYIDNVSANKVPGTIKQKVGTELVKQSIVGRNVMDWELQCQGTITGTGKDNIRTDLIALRTNLSSNALVNGMHDGNYILEDLSWDDDGATAEGYYKYRIRLTEFNQ